MRYTLFLTQRCNLACAYCYVGKADQCMPLDLAQRIVQFAFSNTPAQEEVDISFFGGEPLLEFPLLRRIVDDIQARADFDPRRVKLSVVTNGTLLSRDIAADLRKHAIGLHISCDGRPDVHDAFRRFPNGTGSSTFVERGIRTALETFGMVPVNAVYRPETIDRLLDSIEYLSALGVRQIYLNPDFSAAWTEQDTQIATGVYAKIAERYMTFYRDRRPHYISLIDGKISLLLRGGYHPTEKCRMGEGDFAFTPTGRIYPCERLAGADPHNHAIGSADPLIRIGELQHHGAPGPPINTPCLTCSLDEYCMNWCGCSNYFMTGSYNRVGPFMCASEQACIRLAAQVLGTLEAEFGPTFVDHVGGLGVAPSAADHVGA